MLDLPYNLYVLLFGVYVSLRVACGAMSARHWRLFSLLCPALLLLQGAVLQLFGVQAVRMAYPFITHLPLVLAMMLALRVKWDVSVVCVLISYSMCQLLRWVGLLLSTLPLHPVVQMILHLCCCQMILMLLDRFCLDALRSVLISAPSVLLRLGALPLIYYLYEYFTLFTAGRYAHVLAIGELLPTGMVLFFTLFVVAYHREAERRRQAEQQAAALSMRLTQAGQEISALRLVEERTAVYRHDMRHHLSMLCALLTEGNQAQALDYIGEAQKRIEAIVPDRLCENEAANLLLRAFKSRAEEMNVPLDVHAQLPAALSLPGTELCALLSNGLENALTAAARLPQQADRTVRVLCAVRQGRVLIEIRNPFAGAVEIRGGLPVSQEPGAHYGCLSIRSIVQARKGMCSFEAEGGFFTLRCAVPLES